MRGLRSRILDANFSDPMAYHFYICRTFSTAEDVLKGARHMVAMQIAHEPLVRIEVRQAFRERARLTCKPTKKGLKVRHFKLVLGLPLI